MMNTSSKNVFIGMVKSSLNTVLITVYFAFAFFVACLFLNKIIPRLVPTEQTAQQFWIFGVAALIFCGGGFALLKASRDATISPAQRRVFRSMGLAFEGIILITTIVVWVEAGKYAAWVGQYEPITVKSGVDIRYWVAGMLFTNGAFGNLLAALLTA